MESQDFVIIDDSDWGVPDYDKILFELEEEKLKEEKKETEIN